MALITKPNTFTAGAVIVAAEHNSNYDTVYNDYNGNITNANIAAGAAIDASKLNLGAPGPIGSTTPSSAAFTTISSSGASTLNSNVSVAGTFTVNDGGLADYDVRFESDTESHMFFLDASVNGIGIGTSASISEAINVYGGIKMLKEIYGTPSANTLYKKLLPKAWISFTGSTGAVAIRDSFNVSSLVDEAGAGFYTINWDRDFADVNYSLSGVIKQNSAGAGNTGWWAIDGVAGNPLVGSVKINAYNGGPTIADAEIVNITAFGNQA